MQGWAEFMDGARVRFWNGIKINAASFLVLGRKQEPRRKMKTNKEKENTCWRTNWWHVSWADKDYELIRKTSIKLNGFKISNQLGWTSSTCRPISVRPTATKSSMRRLKTTCAATKHHLQLVDQCACVQQRSNPACGKPSAAFPPICILLATATRSSKRRTTTHL